MLQQALAGDMTVNLQIRNLCLKKNKKNKTLAVTKRKQKKKLSLNHNCQLCGVESVRVVAGVANKIMR